MNTLYQFKCGSSYFFSSFPDYVVKDYDELHICDYLIKDSKILNLKTEKQDIFFIKEMPVSEHIDDCLNSGVPMRAGKYLIPEFSRHIGLTIEDLKQLKPCFDNMDDKHSYEKIIFESYLKNGDFYLTDEQLKEAYEDYKKKRPLTYNKSTD